MSSVYWCGFTDLDSPDPPPVVPIPSEKQTATPPTVIDQLKRFASRLPPRTQSALKRIHYARQIRRGAFHADEAEARVLSDYVGDGDWVIDVGANIGHYTLALSGLVGSGGRVFAFEPIPSTFALLSHNVDLLGRNNVTLINAAASDSFAILGMTVPTVAATGLVNPYMAQISASGELRVACLKIDSLALDGPIRLVKIDAEGHELSVLKGMKDLLQRNAPALIVEGHDPSVERFMSELGYGYSVLPGSWNRIYEHRPTVS